MNFGYEKGEVCNRDRCKGIIDLHPKGDCSCHLRPPCSACVEIREYCPECGYEGSQDMIINDHKVNVNPDMTYNWYEPRKLDNTKIDYRHVPHTHFSQILEGVYPEGTTREHVEALVKGTFGGRFDQFGNGTFRYVAYTD